MVNIDVDTSNVETGLDRFGELVKERLLEYAQKKGLECEAYAKENAPWKNDTGLARSTIEGGAVELNENQIAIYVAGNMEYSPFLEYRWNGKYQILRPTIWNLQNNIWSDFKIC